MNACSPVDLIVWLTWATVGAGFGAMAAALAGNWQAARWAARGSVLGVLAYPVLLIVAFGNIAGADASEKASAYARRLSEAMNCGVLALLAGVLGVVVWISASRRLRAQRTT